MDEVGLGKKLQLQRQKAGLTQQQLCHQTGLSYSTLAKIERGAIKSPSIFTIQQIATALGTSLDELIGHDSSKGATTPKKRSKSGVSFIYFDINGCLVQFFHRAFTRIAEQCAEPSDVIETAFWHHNDAVCRGEMTIDQFNAALAKRFDMPKFDWREYYLEAIEPIEEMRELLTWASEHYKIGLLSNIMPGQIEAMQARNFLPAVNYDAVIASCEVHAIKPEAKIYEIATAKAGVPPAEILLVDDSRTNLVAAEKLDWHVLWFDDFHPSESANRVRSALEY